MKLIQFLVLWSLKMYWTLKTGKKCIQNCPDWVEFCLKSLYSRRRGKKETYNMSCHCGIWQPATVVSGSLPLWYLAACHCGIWQPATVVLCRLSQHWAVSSCLSPQWQAADSMVGFGGRLPDTSTRLPDTSGRLPDASGRLPDTAMSGYLTVWYTSGIMTHLSGVSHFPCFNKLFHFHPVHPTPSSSPPSGSITSHPGCIPSHSGNIPYLPKGISFDPGASPRKQTLCQTNGRNPPFNMYISKMI